MLDKRTAVADDGDLMRSAALVVMMYDELMRQSEGEALLYYIGRVVDRLERALAAIDKDWEAHYGG